ncbi:MAG: hypothetical protein EOT04_01615 [Candidatus Chaera renei]|uniref:Uncharacterized protein n=1 Tax=Candidatus Chaera renei TaxID=2506947 RepID=A0A4Q0AJ47_9BACT|nr:MAG: hypothetical protein EOT04_01615 [Candidatus Chaera renei]
MKRRAFFIGVLPIFALSALLIVVNTTNPLSGGPATILLVFILLYLFFLPFFYGLLNVLAVGWRLVTRQRTANESKQTRLRRRYYVSSVLACLPLFLLALRSIGSVRLVDVGLVMVFIALAAFYVARRA